LGGAGAVFVARVGPDEQIRTKEQRGGVLVIIIFELLLAHLEDEKERSQLLGLLAWWRVREKTSLKEESQLENKRLGAFGIHYSEYVTSASIFFRDCIVL